MTVDALLSRLDHVRRISPGRYLARCSAHKDGSPSLSFRELDDGRVLLHCFAGCPPGEVLAAIGLDFDALFPPRAVGDHRPPERRPVHAEDCLRALVEEAQVAAIVAMRIRHGYDVDDDEFERFLTSIRRIANAAVIAGVDQNDQRMRGRIRKRRDDLRKHGEVAEAA